MVNEEVEQKIKKLIKISWSMDRDVRSAQSFYSIFREGRKSDVAERYNRTYAGNVYNHIQFCLFSQTIACIARIHDAGGKRGKDRLCLQNFIRVIKEEEVKHQLLENAHSWDCVNSRRNVQLVKRKIKRTTELFDKNSPRYAKSLKKLKYYRDNFLAHRLDQSSKIGETLRVGDLQKLLGETSKIVKDCLIISDGASTNPRDHIEQFDQCSRFFWENILNPQ